MQRISRQEVMTVKVKFNDPFVIGCSRRGYQLSVKDRIPQGHPHIIKYGIEYRIDVREIEKLVAGVEFEVSGKPKWGYQRLTIRGGDT